MSNSESKSKSDLMDQVKIMRSIIEEMNESLKRNQQEMRELRQKLDEVDSKTTVMADTSASLAQFIPFVGKLEQICYYVNPMNLFRALPDSDQNPKSILSITS